MMFYMPVLLRRYPMKNKRRYHIIIGSNAYFDKNLPDFPESDDVATFLELVKLSDATRQNQRLFNQHASKLIVKNNNYHGIV